MILYQCCALRSFTISCASFAPQFSYAILMLASLAAPLPLVFCHGASQTTPPIMVPPVPAPFVCAVGSVPVVGSIGGIKPPHFLPWHVGHSIGSPGLTMLGLSNLFFSMFFVLRSFGIGRGASPSLTVALSGPIDLAC